MNKKQELVKQLMWNKSGCGFGICSVAGTFSWILNESTKDLTSIVAISGNPDDYTTEELEKLVAFSKEMTEEYDKQWKSRQGANLICIGKIAEDYWLRKRLSWEIGSMYSKTIDDAIEIFKK